MLTTNVMIITVIVTVMVTVIVMTIVTMMIISIIIAIIAFHKMNLNTSSTSHPSTYRCLDNIFNKI